MILILLIIIILGVAVLIFIQQKEFGKLPSGKRLENIKKSPHYKNGKFQNLSYTPTLIEGINYYKVLKELFLAKNRRPIDDIPSMKTDLLKLERDKDVLIWFGHSSYFIQIDGKKILVDPVLSSYASPISFIIKAFKGSYPYTTDDIPEIDYLFITHDHWDHLDYKTILKLKPKIKKIITGLGTGEHLEYWGYDKNIIIEKDWNEKILLDNNFTAYTVPARHFSGRSLIRNKSLWTSFVLMTPSTKFFLGSDGGYDAYFAEIGKTFGEFDLVILENGQYNKNWKYIHAMPEEVLRAAKDLKAKRLFPIHSSKFVLSIHAWDEPLKKITELNKNENIPLLTPLIGEPVNLKNDTQKFREWWKDIK